MLPHSHLLLLFTTSSQTHIFPEIRIDAVRFLDILLECIPESVTAGWYQPTDSHGSRVLGGYLGILNAGTKYGEAEGDCPFSEISGISLIITFVAGDLKATSTASVVLTSKVCALQPFVTLVMIFPVEACSPSVPFVVHPPCARIHR